MEGFPRPQRFIGVLSGHRSMKKPQPQFRRAQRLLSPKTSAILQFL
jgi:hypothetical protein